MNSRILHVSDFHANERWFEWLIQKSRDFGLVALTGDQLDLLGHDPKPAHLDRIEKLLRRIPVPLAVVSGNHDGLFGATGRLARAGWLKDLRSRSVWVDGDSFEFAGVTIRCFGWESKLSESGLGEVWLSHAPPEGGGTAIVPGGIGFGSWELGRICSEGRGPRLVLGGHVHDPLSWRAKVGPTWSLNPGFAGRDSATPHFNVVDIRTGIAVHHSASGSTDIVRLWLPA